MPNNWEAKVALNGASRDNGRHDKISHLRMRWVKPQSLAYFCGAKKGKRGFEPETKPWDNGTVNGPNAAPRWSSDWTDSDYQTNLPKQYKDDLACGTPRACDTAILSRTSTYPDFSIGSGNGRAIRYGKLYWSRFETNTGDSDDGLAIIRGSQVRKAKTKSLENAYCRKRSLDNGHKYLDRFWHVR